MSGNTTPITIGVAGGTRSGKTTVANSILDRVGRQRIAHIQHDSYYRNLDHLPPAERARINFDHPDSLDTDLLIEHLRQLRNWQPADVPVYDFTTHSRANRTVHVEPRRVVM